MKIFDKINSLYVKAWIDYTEWEELTKRYTENLYKLYLKGLVDNAQFEKYLREYK